MRTLVVGSGGREHALAWRLAQDGHEVHAAPGNPGIARVARCHAVDATDQDALVSLCRREDVRLVVIGPEGPLVAGLADRLRAEGIPVFGPGRAAAALEGSKVFAKRFMVEHGIPTAPFDVAGDAETALAIARGFGFPVVLKADGLAAGKGVCVAKDQDEARRFATGCLTERRFGPAGERLVVEAFLRGEEASLFFLCDGTKLRRFLPARDYKRLADGDEGPNTGGMGAFAPAPLDDALVDRVEHAIVRPVVDGLRARGAEFQGLLYVGLMIGPEGLRVLEFNVRFGDPETQVLLPLVEGDFGRLLLECAEGRLESPLEFREDHTVGVVLAAPGYPDSPRTGEAIEGLDAWPSAAAENEGGRWCFHAGTKSEGPRIVSAGGRVLAVVARDRDPVAARRRAYEGIERLRLPGSHFRHDVGLPSGVAKAG